MNNQEDKISGVLEKIVFKNSENGFMVARLRLEDRDLVTIVGNTVELQIGEELDVSGRWVENKDYGKQFEIKSVQSSIPVTTGGIENYLGSGLIKGIGPVMAKRIVSHFKLDTLKVLDREPGRLTEIEGIGEKRIDLITRSWDRHKNIREVMIFLQSHGISNSYAVKIYNHYGDNTMNVLKINPYRLAEDIFGVGFITADNIALKMGIEKDSIFRTKAGIAYILRKAESEGHCYYPYHELAEASGEFLDAELGQIDQAIGELENEGKIISTGDDVRKIYLKSIYNAEKQVCEKILRLTGIKLDDGRGIGKRTENIKKQVDELASQNGISLDEIQVKAIIGAVTEKMLIITGSPGTGKSTILNFIIRIFEKENMKVLLGAPTGRAAKRLCETTGREAKTLHRLLKYNPRLNKFLKNEDDLIEADVIIIDEASMIDIKLVRSLLAAIKDDARVIFVGDIDQLPSVGPGYVLGDMINSGVMEVIKLRKIYRQEGESLIIKSAHKVRDGIYPYIGNPDSSDFFFIEKNKPDETVDMILTLLTKRIPDRFGYDPFKDIQVLVPTNKGIVGTINLNTRIQEVLNPGEVKINRGSTVFKLNDKVIQLKNNYKKEVFNGDIGYISHIDFELKEVAINFEGRTIKYSFNEMDELSLAYAISIHKSQGSEFKCIVLPLLTSHYLLLQRNLLYTAITRAKELAVLVGSKKAIGMAVNKNIVENRNTGLKELLQSF